MTVVQRAIGDVHHHVFIPLNVIVFNRLNHDLTRNLSSRDQNGAAERTIVRFLRRPGDKVIYRQIRGVVPCASDDEVREIVSIKILLLHGHGIDSRDAHNRQFVVDDQYLSLG